MGPWLASLVQSRAPLAGVLLRRPPVGRPHQDYDQLPSERPIHAREHRISVTDFINTPSSAQILRRILRTRAFEAAIMETGRAGHLGAAFHGSLGHEWISEVVCSAVTPEDWVLPYYRSHHWLLARGLQPQDLAAMICAAPTSPARSAFHLADSSRNVVLSPAIVGQQIPLAVGVALAAASRAVTICSLGDGAQAVGIWWESLQLAAMWQLSVLFVLEDNGVQNYGVSTDLGSVNDLYESAAGALQNVVTISRQHIATALGDVRELVGQVRESRTPGLLRCRTTLEASHSVSREGGVVEATRLRAARTDAASTKEENVVLCPTTLIEEFLAAGVTVAEIDRFKEEANTLRVALMDQLP